MFRTVSLALVCTAVALAGNPAHSADDTPKRCEALKQTSLADVSIDAATLVPAAPAFPEHPERVAPPIPAHCRVQLTIRPTSDSDIKAEVWLPAEGWNGRFLGIGIGGYGGAISSGELRTAVARGYAAATTDTGHGAVGTEVWARGHPERVVDYGHRAIHRMTVAAKEIVRRYYAEPARHAYFSGCSGGGRQALMEALRYPDDYDGILAGAPAADFTGLIVAGFGSMDAALRKHAFPSRKLPLLQQKVLEQCDALDGATDRLIAAPQRCRFDPSRAVCGKSRDENTCFTAGEAETLKQVLAGAVTRSGRVLYPGFSEGGEAPEPPSPGWEGWIVPKPNEPSVPFQLYSSFMRDFLADNVGWKAADFDLERDLARAKRELGAVLDANDPNLTTFARRGGKLIIWHGWADQAIPARATLRYYDSVREKLGSTETQEFSRLYMVPGMQHCWLGPGPWSFNWSGGAVPNADPTTDISAALEAWVEKGRTPGTLTAVRPRDPMSILAGHPPVEVDRSGLLCPHPAVARYDGKGSSKDAKNYACVVEP